MYRRETILARNISIEVTLRRSFPEIAQPIATLAAIYFGIIWLMLCTVLGKSVRRRTVASAVPADRVIAAR